MMIGSGAVAFLENDATAVFEACRVDAPHALTGRIEIDGTEGSLRFEVERLNELEHRIPKQSRMASFLVPLPKIPKPWGRVQWTSPLPS
jgi:hypothetical protein